MGGQKLGDLGTCDYLLKQPGKKIIRGKEKVTEPWPLVEASLPAEKQEQHKHLLWTWRDGSALKSNYCACRGQVNPQHHRR